MDYKRIKQFTLAALILLCSAGTILAQSRVSSQAHEGRVNVIATSETPTNSDSAFYTGDENGFIIKWENDGLGEHYQVSNYKIALISKSPSSGNIAIYETDGYSTHRVSVIDWRTFSRRYTKYYDNPVTSLSFSEKGTYLLVGCSKAGSASIYDASTGRLRKTIEDCPSNISFIRTSASEKSLILYSSTGALCYYDMTNYSLKQRVSCESSLNQTVLFGTGNRLNCYFAGVKGNSAYVINAMTGKTIGQFSGTNPYIFTSKSSRESGLYMAVNSGKYWELQLLDNVSLETLLLSSSTRIQNPIPLRTVKQFTGLKSGEIFTYGRKNSDTIIMGTSYGNIYTMSDAIESEAYTLMAITDKMFEKIYDITSDRQNFYMLTDMKIFKSSYDRNQISQVAENPGYANIAKYDNYIVLYSKNSSKSVALLNLDNPEAGVTEIFKPKYEISSLHVNNGMIVTVQGRSLVTTYNLSTGSITDCYTSTSIEDAIATSTTDLYVAKNRSNSSDSALVYVNIETKETLPLNIDGYVAFSLSYDSTKNDNLLYGILMTQKSSNITTQVFSYNTQTKQLKSVYTTQTEDSLAFTYLNNSMLYTNIGSTQIRSVNTSNSRTIVYRRSSSIPLKTESTSDKLAVLNMDGSISWYNPSSQNVLSDWYLTVNGDWYAF